MQNLTAQSFEVLAKEIYSQIALRWDSILEDKPNRTSEIAKIVAGFQSKIDLIVPNTIFTYGEQWKGTGGPNHQGEYLWDHVWAHGVIIRDKKTPEAKFSDALTQYKGLFVAMECELSGKGMVSRWKDFVKLTDVRADLRIFIGRVKKKDGSGGQKSFLDCIEKVVKAHRHKQDSDLYLIMLAIDGEENNEYGLLRGWFIRGKGDREILPYPASEDRI